MNNIVEKGGVGSGIRGHRTIRQVINGIPHIRRFKILETLKQENVRRDVKKTKENLMEQLVDDFIEKVLNNVKIKLKAMSKEDWIRAWKEDPHWDKEESSRLVDVLLDSYKVEPGSILEIGCGNGVDSIAFGKKTKAKVVGIDISSDAIKVANESNDLKNVKFMVGDAEKLDFEDEQFDLVYSMAVLHSTNLKKSISEVSRVLKPGGQSLLFLYQKTLHEEGEDEKNFKIGEIEKLFKKNDLTIFNKQKGESGDKDEDGKHTHYWIVYILEK